MAVKWIYYEGKIHKLLHDYGNGWAEIQEVNTIKVKLIETKCLVPMKNLNKKDVH